MSRAQARLAFLGAIFLLLSLMISSFGTLATKVRFGLDFRGGYEIYYVVTPIEGKNDFTAQDLLNTAAILRQRADSIGMAEPDIRIEGHNHIRLKLAGISSAEESRSLLGNAQGLPTVLTEKYTQTVGSVLGNTALKDTVTAGLIGIVCIFGLLISVYRGVGLIAAFCTLLYLWILILVFNAFHATLSLSTVVAFVLGIGVAADASIICFERIRESYFNSGNLALADATVSGFSASFHTIRDANLVTALAMIALFIAGIGPIQGFSLTMLVSIFIGIFSNYFVVRVLCFLLIKSELLPAALIISPKYKAKEHDAGKIKGFDFIGLGKPAILSMLVVIIVGALYFKAHGLNLDIDFTAGTALDIDIDQQITQEAAIRIMSDAGTTPATTAIGGKNMTHIAARFDEILNPAALKHIIDAFKYHYHSVEYEENTADPSIARDFARHSIYAISAAFFSILIFICWRFSLHVAIATVIPIFLDVMLVSAIFSLFKLEIDVTYIAAMLTVIGYSLNDKIVIFGRINENLNELLSIVSSQATDAYLYKNIANRSILQTLGRSIYTVLTVVMASACLYFFASEPLQMFSLAILIGLISGAFSSIFISSIIWLTLAANGTPQMQNNTEQFGLNNSLFIIIVALIIFASTAAWLEISRATPELATRIANLENKSNMPLGDLSKYKEIVRDTTTLVESEDFSAAKKRITDLETMWDQAEESMRPMNPDDWRVVDKAIDRALTKIRSGTPDKQECLIALSSLIAKIESFQH